MPQAIAGDGVARYLSPSRLTEQDAYMFWLVRMRDFVFLVFIWTTSLFATDHANASDYDYTFTIFFGTVIVAPLILRLGLTFLEQNASHHYLFCGTWLYPANGTTTIAHLREYSLASSMLFFKRFLGSKVSQLLEDYHSKLAFVSAVRSGNVCLVRGEYLVNLARQGKAMPRRQVSAL